MFARGPENRESRLVLDETSIARYGRDTTRGGRASARGKNPDAGRGLEVFAKKLFGLIATARIEAVAVEIAPGGTMQQDRAPLDLHETLFVSARKRFVPVYNSNIDGTRELVLYCGPHEISFDEPDLFPWAEKLIQQESFMAGEAAGWSAQPLEWPRVKDLLEALMEAGLVDRSPPVRTTAQVPLSSAHLEFLKAEEERPVLPAPRFWNPDPGAAVRETVGRDLEVGYVESVMPVHRLAHIALDREGRQVGEINAFPDPLRLRIPTEWKTCGYAGTRYQDEMPMNMTALRSMIAHWRPVLSAALAVREKFL
ncbi:MAG TPA: hypothetical protein VFE90_02745, partial [Myxococcales bacterium]|nr:hypothetical protein [Myxococcales bacterium]